MSLQISTIAIFELEIIRGTISGYYDFNPINMFGVGTSPLCGCRIGYRQY